MSSVNLTPNIATSGNGIDVTAVVDQILNAERAPERVWQAQQSALSVQAAALNTIKTDLADLQNKVNTLKDLSGALTAKTITSSNGGILTASGTTSAVPGNHVIQVSSLATTSSYYTDPIDIATVLSDGSFDLQVGSGPAVNIPVDSSNNTLDSLAASINAADAGVSASVVTDASGSRLALISNSTGAPGDLTISNNTVAELTFNKGVTGTNASLTVDGVPISSDSNSVSGVLTGVTLNLVSASPGTDVQLSVASDTKQATTAISSFVASYNKLIGDVNAQFAFDTTTNTAGPLAGDSTVRSLQSSLLSDVTYAISGNNGIVNLASLGVDFNNDGTLTIDTATLSDVLANQFTDVQNFFQALSPDAGFAQNFGSDLLNLTDATNGLVNLDLSQNTSTQSLLTDQINDFEDRLAIRQQYLINQYSQVDAMLRQFPLIMQQLNSQLGTLSTLSQ